MTKINKNVTGKNLLFTKQTFKKSEITWNNMEKY